MADSPLPVVGVARGWPARLVLVRFVSCTRGAMFAVKVHVRRVAFEVIDH